MSKRGQATKVSKRIAKTKGKLQIYNELAKIESISKGWGLDTKERKVFTNNILKSISKTKGRGKFRREALDKKGLRKAMRAVIALDVQFTGGANVKDGIEAANRVILKGKVGQVKFKQKEIYDKRSLRYKKSLKTIAKAFKENIGELDNGLKISTRARNIYNQLETAKQKTEFVKKWAYGKNRELVKAGMLKTKNIRVVDTKIESTMQQLTRPERKYLNELLELKKNREEEVFKKQTARALEEARLEFETNAVKEFGKSMKAMYEAEEIYDKLPDDIKNMINAESQSVEDWLKKALRQGRDDAEWYNDNRQLIIAYNENKNEQIGNLLNEAKENWKGNREAYDNWVKNELPEILRNL